MDSLQFGDVQDNLAAQLESPGLKSVYVETLTGKIAHMIEPMLNESMVIYIGGAIMLSDVRRFYGAQEVTED